MYPTISIGGAEIPAFTLAAIVGACSFILITLYRVSKLQNSAREAAYILPKLFIALAVGFVGAIFFDALFKIGENGGFKLSGMTFYGGIITGVAALSIMLAIFKKNTSLGVEEWLNLLTVPFLVFHFFGRIGCFLGGCCFGKPTDSVWGIVFPDNEAAGIFHNGEKVFPTQLYEAAAIALIALNLLRVRHAFWAYCICYPAARFMIEFLRGDDRGGYLGIFSPAQVISLILIAGACAYLAARAIIKKSKNRDQRTE